MRYGYIRVSTKEQNIDRQLTAILKENVDTKNIFIDKASGKDFNRKQYRKLIRKLKEGDELYIKSIDRLGRNYDEIIKEWNLITKEKSVEIIVLDFPLLDTRAKVSGVTGKFISDIVLQILSYVAQIERENILQRQMEGIRWNTRFPYNSHDGHQSGDDLLRTGTGRTRYGRRRLQRT